MKLNIIDLPAKFQLEHQVKVFALLLGVIAILLGLGFMLGDSSNSTNYTILLELFNSSTWTAIFFLYGCTKLLQFLDRLSYKLRVLTSMFGSWLWLYVLLSFMVFDPSKLSPAELLIILPLACEAGELVLDIFNLRLCSPSQRNPSV